MRSKRSKKQNLNEKRAALRQRYSEQDFKRLKTIEKLALKSAADPNAIFDNLMRIISDTGVLFQAMGNISSKKGALTPGAEFDKRTADKVSTELIEKLSQKLKDGTFRFNPIRRIYMDKSGKAPVTTEQKEQVLKLHQQGKVTMAQIKELKIRPLGIPSFPDKIVQEAMRMVLSAIYEPEFTRINCNFGFRLGKGCQDAIHQIQQKAKAMDFVLEGDIKGAFDNVVHKRMINILKKKIKDPKFLQLVWGGLKCGIIYLNYRQDSEIGTTQGSILSPLLYNIYFHEFDNYIYTEFQKMVDEINGREDRKPNPANKLYDRYSYLKKKLQLPKKMKELHEMHLKLGPENEKVRALAKEVKETKKQYKAIFNDQKKLKSYARSRQTLRFWYTRYADDWVFFTNADIDRVTEWKTLFTEWIQTNLELAVSEEKTKITNIRKGERAKFLGYSLTMSKKGRTVMMGNLKTIRTDMVDRTKKTKEKLENKVIFMKRTINTSVIVTWDRERVLTRLKNNGFIEQTHNKIRGISKRSWSTLEEPEIIDRFNYMIRGYVNYYAPVTDHPLDLDLLYYLLKYSCAHTLCQKKKTTLNKIFTKYGKDLKVKYVEKTQTVDSKTNEKETKTIEKEKQLLTWKDCKHIMKEILYSTRSKQKKKKKKTGLNFNN